MSRQIGENISEIYQRYRFHKTASQLLVLYDDVHQRWVSLNYTHCVSGTTIIAFKQYVDNPTILCFVQIHCAFEAIGSRWNVKLFLALRECMHYAKLPKVTRYINIQQK